jgi:hypothetical protein
MKNFQRDGVLSNAHAGRDFENTVKEFFATEGIQLSVDIALPIGIGDLKKEHTFDLGNRERKVIVECKSHTWTEGGNVPSAKLTVWNEAMYYFHASPPEYRKILFVLKDFSDKRKETLGEYYIRTYSHLIPPGVEVWEYDENTKKGKRIN